VIKVVYWIELETFFTVAGRGFHSLSILFCIWYCTHLSPPWYSSTVERARRRVGKFVGREGDCIGYEVEEVSIAAAASRRTQEDKRQRDNTILEIVLRVPLVGLTSGTTTQRKGERIDSLLFQRQNDEVFKCKLNGST